MPNCMRLVASFVPRTQSHPLFGSLWLLKHPLPVAGNAAQGASLVAPRGGTSSFLRTADWCMPVVTHLTSSKTSKAAPARHKPRLPCSQAAREEAASRGPACCFACDHRHVIRLLSTDTSVDNPSSSSSSRKGPLEASSPVPADAGPDEPEGPPAGVSATFDLSRIPGTENARDGLFALVFTCCKCNTRSAKKFSKVRADADEEQQQNHHHSSSKTTTIAAAKPAATPGLEFLPMFASQVAYNNGVVIVRCPGCKNREPSISFAGVYTDGVLPSHCLVIYFFSFSLPFSTALGIVSVSSVFYRLE